MAVKEAGLLLECKTEGCAHAAYLHHFSGYLGYKGQSGRGKCAHPGCECEGFIAEVAP